MQNTHTLSVIVKFMQTFSVDVVIGALAMGMFAVKWCNVSLPSAWWFILGLAVWIIYTSDHLIDSLNKQEKSSFFRHRLHHRLKAYLRIVTFALIAVTLLLAILYLDKQIILYGICLGLVVALYLLFVAVANRKNSYFFKELFIAVIYVAGIWLAPLVQRFTATDLSTISILLLFILLTVSEGIIVSCYELSEDQSDHFGSFTTQFGATFTKRVALILLITSFVSSLVLAYYTPKAQTIGFLITATMSVILLLLLTFPSFFTKRNSYHLIGEITFWLPAIFWFIPI